MAWKKAPPELVATFEKAFPKANDAERRQMFGYPAGFVNGNLFGGIFQDRVMVRLDPTTAPKGAKPFEPMAGRAMKGYVEVPASAITSPAQLAKWLEAGRAHTATLPRKAKKAAPKR